MMTLHSRKAAGVGLNSKVIPIDPSAALEKPIRTRSQLANDSFRDGIMQERFKWQAAVKKHKQLATCNL